MNSNNTTIKDPSRFLKRMSFIIPIVFLLGFIFYKFVDKDIGIGFFVGGFVAVALCFVIYIRLKKRDFTSAENVLPIFYIISAIILLVILVLALIFEEFILRDFVIATSLILFWLVYGIYQYKKINLRRNKMPVMIYNKTKWKEAPIGMKAVMILLYLGVILSLISFFSDITKSSYFLGFVIQYPYAVIFTISFLAIDIYIIQSIHNQSAWKPILFLQGFKLLNSLVGAVHIILTPLPKLYYMINRQLPDVSPEILKAVEFKAKLIGFIPMAIGLIIGVIIWAYVYKNKGYFKS